MMEQQLAKRFYSLAFIVLVVLVLVVGKSLILPLVLCALLALLLNPAVTFLERFFLPRFVSAILMLALLALPVTWLSMELSEPIQKWARVVPEYSKLFNEQLEELNTSLSEQMEQSSKAETVKQKSTRWLNWFASAPTPKNTTSKVLDTEKVTESIKQSTFDIVLGFLSAAPYVLAQVLGGAVLIIFILSFSPVLFHTYVNSLCESDKQKTIVLQKSIEKQLSGYVSKITMINFCLGLSSGLGFYIAGLDDYLLWGATVGFLNFIPYIGMLIGILLVGLASTIQFDFSIVTLLPLTIYISLNLLESQWITPLVLSNQMQINPLVLLIWVAIWFWIWGIVGLLIALPLLACVKITLYQTGGEHRWLKIISAK
jgi:predicted PurR-regulated permease PerM